MSDKPLRPSERAAALEAERQRLANEEKRRADDVAMELLQGLDPELEDSAITNLKDILTEEQRAKLSEQLDSLSKAHGITKPPVTRPSPEQLSASRREPTPPPVPVTIPSPPPKMTPPRGGFPIPSTAYVSSGPAPRPIPGTHTLDKGFPPSADRLLIVDDEADIRLSLRELLSEAGYRVYTAECGFQAIMSITKNPDIDLIILDLMMPNVNGFQFIEWLNASPWADKPVLIISAGRPAQLETFEDRYVFAKPLDVDRLMRTVRSAIQSHHRAS